MAADIDTSLVDEQEVSLRQSTQHVTGFEPDDIRAPAPDRVPSAIEVFSPAVAPEPVDVVDPLGHVSEKERRQHDQKVDGIVKAQRDAESLLGVTLRR